MKDNNNYSIPQLRFPEFTGEWVEKKFKDIAFPVGEKNRDNLPYERYSISNEFGFYPQSEQFEGGGGYLKNVDCSGHIIVPPHSFAYNPARINVGSIGYQNLDKDVIVSPLYEVFKTTEDCDDAFLWHWLHSNVFHKMVLETQEGGVRQCFAYNKLRECSIILPPTPTEQQKIADCLSSLDDMIRAEGQKTEALRKYKRGLMQQLFPANGVTTPQLRFPEFTGEWEEKKLGDSFDERVEKNRGDLPLLSLGEEGLKLQSETERKDNSNADKSKYLRVALGDIAYNTMRMWQGRCVYSNIEGIVSPAYTVCKPKQGIDGLFHYYLFKTNRMIHIFHQNSQGLVSDTLNLKYDSFSKIKYFLPPTLAEQQKIADCLFSLDDMITAQAGKTETLREYKRGLMQQLFPQPSK